MGIRLLLIEDEDDIADFLIWGLREEGFVIERAVGGADGWQQMQTGAWDVVLLDWWLPDVDGLTLLKQFRRVNQTTPVLFLTARDAVADRVQGLESGADDYLCKPFAFEELVARIRVMARRLERKDAPVLVYQDVQVDLATQRAERAGHRLELTGKEYALLVYLLRHPGEVLSRSRIYQEVWAERHAGLSNTLEVHVMELRKKLEAHGPRLIHTVRSRGYSFGDERR
jgi:two-component system copper resistance phosphate regulon response regulator CusR